MSEEPPRRHRRRGGVPADPLLAAGGGPADDRRQCRARDAALRRPRSTRWSAASSATATSRVARTARSPSRLPARLTRRASCAATASSSASSPTCSACPGTRSTRRPSASSTRCRPCSSSACSPRSATPPPVPTATPSPPARASRACRSPTSRWAPRCASLRFENEAEDLLRYLKESGIEPGLRGTLAAHDAEEVVVEAADGQRCVLTPSVAETVSVIANPSPPPRTALPEQLVLGQRYGR